MGLKPGCDANFSLIATLWADGSATGQWTDQYGPADGLHAVVDCVKVQEIPERFPGGPGGLGRWRGDAPSQPGGAPDHHADAGQRHLGERIALMRSAEESWIRKKRGQLQLPGLSARRLEGHGPRPADRGPGEDLVAVAKRILAPTPSVRPPMPRHKMLMTTLLAVLRRLQRHTDDAIRRSRCRCRQARRPDRSHGPAGRSRWRRRARVRERRPVRRRDLLRVCRRRVRRERQDLATTAASNSGDATIQTAKAKNCTRRFTLRYPDAFTSTVLSFNNLLQLQNTTYSIPLNHGQAPAHPQRRVYHEQPLTLRSAPVRP